MTPTIKRFGFQAMGVPCEIQVYDESRINARNNIRQLAGEVTRLEQKYSRFRRDSLLTEINFSAGDKLGIKIDKETRSLLSHALTCFEQSEGLFDITTGVLYRLWDFRQARVPEQKEIDKALERVGFHKVSVKGSRLHMPKGMELDLGGIVKEYAADSVAQMARRMGINSGLINLGGDFTVIGPQPGGEPWTVGIANPKQRNAMMAKIDLHDGGLASSGDYERFFEFDGKRYSHLLNPKTGWPSSGLRAVSVAGNLCTVAGSMATIAMLKEEDAALAYLAESGLPHVYMGSDEVIAGPGLKAEGKADSEAAPEPVASAEPL